MPASMTGGRQKTGAGFIFFARGGWLEKNPAPFSCSLPMPGFVAF